MFKFRDSLELYQMRHSSDNLFLMLLDYRLDNRLSRTLLNNQILIRLGVLHPLYNDSEMMKFAIDNWFEEADPIIKKLLDLRDGYDELNPFDNVNWREDYDGTRNDVNVDVNNRQRGETDNETRDVSTEDSEEVVNTVSAYDSSEYQPRDKSNSERASTTGEERTKGISENESISDRFTGDRDEEHTLVHSGKEGIENYTKMLEDARRAAQFDIYDWILDRLERAVCLGVY